MGRFLASSLAGILLITGGWFGWTSADRIDAGINDAADFVAPSAGDGQRIEARGHLPSPSSTDPYRALSIAGTDPIPPCVLPAPTGADGLNALMTQLDREPTLQGGDHGGSVALADGRRMFVYGDTIRDVSTVSPFMVRNSVLIVDHGCLNPMTREDGAAVIPDDPDNTGYWPMSLRAVEVKGGTRVQVIANRVRATTGHVDGAPESPDAFQTLGSALATFEIPRDRTPRLVDVVQLTPDTTDPRVPTWGSAMWEQGGWIHVFGTASNATKSTAGWSLRVARTRPDDLADADAWEYWDGARWVAGTPEAAQAPRAALIPAEQGVSHVLSVFARDGAWFAVSKEGDYTGDTLAVWKAPTVTGPWTKHAVRPLDNPEGMRLYTPLAHPDVDLPDGRLLVSWSRAPVNHGLYYTNPELYRPHFEEVELP